MGEPTGTSHPWAIWPLAYLVLEWTIRLGALAVVPQRRSADAARSWLLLIFFLPVVGLPLYWAIGRPRLPRERVARHLQARRLVVEAVAALRRDREDPGEDRGRLARLVEALGHMPVSGGSRVELLPGYDAPLEALESAIDGAGDRVHLVTYILGADAVGERLGAALTRAARRGVRCRLLVDALGGRAGLERLAPRLREGGVEVVAALPARLLRPGGGRVDLRNHRKIAVIDGRVGFIGSQNLVGGEFIPGCPNEELVARVEGPIASQLEATFLCDWWVETGVDLRAGPGGVATVVVPEDVGATRAQLLPSGPTYPAQNQRDAMVELLGLAERRATLTTPYFVPDQVFLAALAAAARRGVEIDLVVSRRNNQRLAQLAGESYFDELLAAGVRIHLYRPRFLHAKHLEVDGEVAIVGSTNLDIRSFALNEEASLVVYDRKVALALRGIDEARMALSDRIEPDAWAGRPLPRRLAQGIARLFDSVL